MRLVGLPDAWLDLLDSLVPDILDLVLLTWQDMPPLPANALEDLTTEELCKQLRKNRNACQLPFRIDIQQVELDPAAGVDQGKMDIVFSPLLPTEDIYFCLECKRLNVVDNSGLRTYASEYVAHGMLRFITGQYAAHVHHGGMLAYVLDGNVHHAVASVSRIICRRHEELAMEPPGNMYPSTIVAAEHTVKETHHTRAFSISQFCIHHIFALPATT